MAYITQYEADMAGDARNRQNQAAIGQGLIGGIQAMNENRARAIAERDKLAQAKMLQEKYDQDKKVKDALLAKLQYEEDQRGMDPLETDEYKKKKGIAQIMANNSQQAAITRDELIANRQLKADQMKQEAEQRKLENEKKKNISKAAIADFDVADENIIPTSKDAEEVKKQNTANKSFQQLGGSVVEKLGNADPRNPNYYFSNDWKLLNQDLTKMKLQAKNLEDLGVLNGPDLSLVNETLGGINAGSLAYLGKEKAQERIKAALTNAQKTLENAAAARGYKPRVAPQKQYDQKHVEAVKGMSDEELMKIINGGA